MICIAFVFTDIDQQYYFFFSNSFTEKEEFIELSSHSRCTLIDSFEQSNSQAGTVFQNRVVEAMLSFLVSHLWCKKTFKNVFSGIWKYFSEILDLKKKKLTIIVKNLLCMCLEWNLWQSLEYLKYIRFKCLNNVKMCAYALPKHYILYFILLKNQMLWLIISFRCNFKFYELISIPVFQMILCEI